MATMYFKLQPSQIVEDITREHEQKKTQIQGMHFLVYPNVYPSDKFRTTNFILDSIKPFIRGLRVCDMGCGLGVIGLFALQHGAKHVVQADINPLAAENARANRDLYRYSSKEIEIFESDCFDQIPTQIFDIIIFNIPFHSEPHKISNPLEYAFHDPNFTSTKKFLHQAVNYCFSKTEIVIAFSNKGNVKELEKIFETFGFKWTLWKKININQAFDNRLYKLKISDN